MNNYIKDLKQVIIDYLNDCKSDIEFLEYEDTDMASPSTKQELKTKTRMQIIDLEKVLKLVEELSND